MITNRESTPIPEPVAQLQHQLEQFRSARPGRTKQWEVVEEAAELVKPTRDELIRQAAQGEVVHNDDASMKVLKLEREPEFGKRSTGNTPGNWSIWVSVSVP